jgi:hypothetical protein
MQANKDQPLNADWLNQHQRFSRHYLRSSAVKFFDPLFASIRVYSRFRFVCIRGRFPEMGWRLAESSGPQAPKMTDIGETAAFGDDLKS